MEEHSQGGAFLSTLPPGPGLVELAVMKKVPLPTACPCRSANGVGCVISNFLSIGKPWRDPEAALLNEQARSKGLSGSHQAVMQCVK